MTVRQETGELALPEPPPRGTRPRNRRALIIEAASALFYQRGYAAVSMSEIADAVAMRPSALYRHFSGKQQLLAAVLSDLVDRIEATLTEGADEQVTTLLAAAALRHRELGVMWQRDGRHLAEGDRAELRDKVRGFRRQLTTRIQSSRPTVDRTEAVLLATAAMSVLISPSFHHQQLPSPIYQELLEELVVTVMSTELPPPGEVVDVEDLPRISVRSRRESILNTAVALFAERGYAGVSFDDIAEQIGMTGPNLYNYFPSKADLLLACLQRGTAWLFRDLIVATEQATGHHDALHRLLRAYATFTLANSSLIDLLITEQGSLAPEHQTPTRQTQTDYIAEWVHLLRTVRPDLDEVPARIRIQAWFTIVHDTARAERRRRTTDLVAALEVVGVAVLGLGED